MIDSIKDEEKLELLRIEQKHNKKIKELIEKHGKHLQQLSGIELIKEQMRLDFVNIINNNIQT